MSIQKIPLEAVNKIRQYIKDSLVLPESENHPRSQTSLNEVDELPEPDSLDALGDLFKLASLSEEATYAPNDQGRWFISATSPSAALIKLPGLTLKSGLRLVSYLYRAKDSGLGMIWAVPEDMSTTAQLEKALMNSGDAQCPPQPEGALTDVMAAIEGDRTPVSFAIASILRRELKEFGTLGKYCDWSHHRLVAELPTQVHWQWRIDPPKDLSPKVLQMPDGRSAVEFYTCRIAQPVGIYRHIDQYPVQDYQATSSDREVAVAVKK